MRVVITVSFTDENGRVRGNSFWLKSTDVRIESERFSNAGYSVVITFPDVPKENL